MERTEVTGKSGRTPQARMMHNPAIVGILLLCAFLLTVLAWYTSSRYIQERARLRFAFRVKEVQDAIVRRMQNYEQVLRGGVGLFNVNNNVSREDWHTYVSTLDLRENYPGIQGMGFTVRIPAEAKESHLAQVRAEGFPDYDIRPDSARELYFSIVYLEPFDARNKRAFGFDMYSEPTRRAAMDQAWQTARPALSGRVKLVQETETDVQHGFLLYLPVYKQGSDTAGEDERRDALLGFVYSPFRTRDLMHGILGRNISDIVFDIYDGETIAAEHLLYSSDAPHETANAAAAEFVEDVTIHPSGHPWTIRFSSSPDFITRNESSLPMLIGIGGVAINLILFYIFWTVSSLSRSNQQRARELEEKNRQLENYSEQLRTSYEDLETKVKFRNLELEKRVASLEEENARLRNSSGV